MKLLVLGDSLPFGRPSHGVKLEMTWPYLLENSIARTTLRARGGATIDDTRRELETLVGYWGSTSGLARPFEAIILQQGIVDCCPRPLPRLAHRAVRQLPMAGRSLAGGALVPRRYWRPWTSLGRFEQEANRITAAAHQLAKHVFWLEIARPAHYLVENCGDFSTTVRTYNAILKAVPAQFVSLWNDGDSSQHLLPDGHHLNLHGHRYVARMVDRKALSAPNS